MNIESLEKYIKGEPLSEEEREAVIRWISSSPENYEQYKSLHKVHDILLWNDELELTGENTGEEHIGKNNMRRLFFSFSKYAAVLLAAIIGSYFFFSKDGGSEESSSSMHKLFVPAGQRAELSLPDGTKVWLNAKTTFTFPEKFDKDHRNVQLDGEAYFDVEKDEERPFTVSTNKYDIKVLGTEFNVTAYSESPLFETSLLEGEVEITGSNEAKPSRLTPNNQAYLENGRLKIVPLTDQGHLLWKEGIIYFDNESVQDIMSKLELYFDVKISIKNRSLVSYRYSGKFRTKDGVEQVLKVLQLKHKFKYTKDDVNNIIIIE